MEGPADPDRANDHGDRYSGGVANTRSGTPPVGARLPPAWRPSLFEVGPLEVDGELRGLTRHPLADGAWVDHLPGWVGGSAALFDRLIAGLDWSGRDVPMYGQIVAQPRLTAPLPERGLDPVAGPIIEQIRQHLSRRYDQTLGGAWANLYRDGADSVAWHGDRIARERTDALVAIVSLGERRPFRLRPKGGGRSMGFALGGGDLLVMGGTCQRTWQHSVPKVRRAGPRISLTFRPKSLTAPSG
jgi:alkylated DNA repair dioxygenase AlkB